MNFLLKIYKPVSFLYFSLSSVSNLIGTVHIFTEDFLDLYNEVGQIEDSSDIFCSWVSIDHTIGIESPLVTNLKNKYR